MSINMNERNNEFTRKAITLGVAKSDTTREPDTTRHKISRLWVEP